MQNETTLVDSFQSLVLLVETQSNFKIQEKHDTLPGCHTDSVRVMLDLECDADRFLSALRSFASFSRWARSFWYSAATSLFFVLRIFFNARRWRFLCRTTGVTNLWIFGALVWGFLPNRNIITNSDKS